MLLPNLMPILNQDKSHYVDCSYEFLIEKIRLEQSTITTSPPCFPSLNKGRESISLSFYPREIELEEV